MKYYALGLFLIFSFSAMHGFEPSERNVYVRKHAKYSNSLLKQLCSSYLASLAVSGLIGATTGGVVRHLEKRFDIESSPVALFLMLAGWLLESELRNDLIAGFQRDLDTHQIEHKKSLMFKGAWLASWLAYLQV